MSFQGYLDSIRTKTGRSPADFRKLADRKGWMKAGRLTPEVKAGEVVAWLRKDFELGHGHAMAIVALLKGSRKEDGKQDDT